MVPELESAVVFEPEYRDPEALRGIEGFSHLWLIWQFSEALTDTFSPTVRPPRLGGNVRMGVFATRSPFRPNSLGLSCVELVRTESRPGLGTVLVVRGADLMDGTPIFDVKPYIPYADARPEARSGFAPDAGATLSVCISDQLLMKIPENKREALRGVLGKRPPAPLPARPGAGLRDGLCKSHRALYRGGRGTDGNGNKPHGGDAR